MQGGSDKAGQDDKVPKLAPGWEAMGAGLSPEEGFLLSRIDGATSWHVLRQIAGLPPEQVDRCLERWLKEGLVELEAGRSANGQSSALGGPTTRVPAAPVDSGQVDPSLEIDVEVQEKVLAFEATLERSYYEILGVARDADDRAIKRAYFQLSKIFHPDRYFGREVGDFAPRLDRVFKKVALAYELLMDPTTRAEIERTMPAPPPPPEPEPEPTPVQAAPEPGTPPAPPRKPTRREMLERLRRQFRIPEKILTERKFRAKQFAEAARVSGYQRKWKDAAASIRLAIAFDPWTDEYKETFAGIQVEVNQLRAAELEEQANGAMDARSANEALRLYEEAMGYRPVDATIHAKAAAVACELESWDRAFEYAERACELAPEVATHHLVLARALRGQGLRSKAQKVLEHARERDPGSTEILEELKRFRQRPGGASGGKS